MAKEDLYTVPAKLQAKAVKVEQKMVQGGHRPTYWVVNQRREAIFNRCAKCQMPGEVLRINVMQEGKEHGQGVGYMDDGTMVVVENGHDYIGEYKDVVVTKVLQTAAGRMIFARVEEDSAKKKK